MMVSANSASCTPAEPTVAGPSALKKRFTSSSRTGLRGTVMTAPRTTPTPTRQNPSTPAITPAPAEKTPGRAGDQHAPGGRVARCREDGRREQRRPHGEIEQDRRGGGRRE